MSELSQLSKFIADLQLKDVPENVRQAAVLHVLDTVGTALGASQQEQIRQVSESWLKRDDTGSIHVWGQKCKAGVSTAVFLNAMMGHTQEMDDVHTKSKTHIGTVVIPAAWGLTEYLGASGRDFILAVICGYETMSRIGMAFGVSSHRNKGWHVTATAGTFGAAAACAKLLGLNAEQTTYALGLAGAQSFGTWGFLGDGSTNKVLNPARAAQVGMESAFLAQAGMTGPEHILTTEDGGILAMMSDESDPTFVVKDMGKVWQSLYMDNKPDAASKAAGETEAAGDWEWERDIEMVCVYDVGSGTDTTLRAICPLVEKKLGVNIVINNVSGGSGLTGLEYFYQQPADGYTYVMLTPTHVIKGVNNEASFDVKNEIVPVCCLVQDSNVVFANTSLPYSDWEGLVEYAKANPGVPTLTLQSITGVDAMSAQQLFEEAGIDVTLVAADGAEAYSMVIGGHADMTLGSPADGKQYVDAGQVNPLIIINTERSSALPDVPCSSDFGLTADLGPWRAIMAKKGTPQEAIDSLEAAFTDVMDNDDTWKEWKEVNGLNDRDGQFTQEEMKQVWSDYFDTIANIGK